MQVLKIKVSLFIISMKREDLNDEKWKKSLKEYHTFIALIYPYKVSNQNGSMLINLLKVPLGNLVFFNLIVKIGIFHFMKYYF